VQGPTKERGRQQVDGPLRSLDWNLWVKDHAYGKGWIKTDAGWKWTGAQYYDAKWVKKAITRLVLVETLGGMRRPPSSSSTCSPRKRVGTNTDRTVGGVGERLLLVVHHTQQISMAAVAGDADNINKQARKMHTNWLKFSE